MENRFPKINELVIDPNITTSEIKINDLVSEPSHTLIHLSPTSDINKGIRIENIPNQSFINLWAMKAPPAPVQLSTDNVLSLTSSKNVLLSTLL